MTISYKRDMTHNYMVPDLTAAGYEDDYRIRMLTENHIRGLLPCSLKKINCQSHFFYDITSRQSMEHIYGSRSLNSADIRALLRGLYRALKEVKKYLLDVDRIVLKPDMIYMDIETREPYFCYLPGYQGDLLQSFRELTAYLLEHLDQNDSSAVLSGYEIYRKARIENYSLEKLLQEAGRPEAADTVPPEYDGSALPPDIPEYVPDTSENTPRKGSAGYSVRQKSYEDAPRKGSAGYTVRPEPYEGAPRKGSSRYAASDEEALRPTGSRKNTGSGFPDAKKSAAGAGRNKVSDKKAEKPKKTKHEKKSSAEKQADDANPSSRVFLIVCFGFALFLALVAMWLWKLDTTQIGGIIFLLAGLLAYGLSLEEKKKKKKEKQKDKALAKAMEDFQEEPYYEEVPHFAENRHPKNSYTGFSERPAYASARSSEYPTYDSSGVLERPAYASARSSGYPMYDSSGVSERPAYASAHSPEYPAYDSSGVSERPAYASARAYGAAVSSADNERRRRLGDTGVLCEENGDYEPHLVLVSADPRRKDGIVLENDSYIVRKLPSQSDIVLEHSSVSRVHARIQRYGKDYYLCDMNSTNGTFLNGQRLAIKEPVKIRPDDEIAFARVRYRVGIC